jgi:hypothetical protein
MKNLVLIFLLCCKMSAMAQSDYIKLSQELLYAAKTGDSTRALIEQLYRADEDQLNNQLPDDDKRKAFWLNIYNTFVQTTLAQDQEQYKNLGTFYSKKFIPITGQYISLDKIEHGILRRSRNKLSLGYLGKLFPGAFEKKFRVKHIDYRIHFALNCGAKSCPPIAFYDPNKIDTQLDMATRNYLKNETIVTSDKKSVQLPAIMSWFRADFGGKKGMHRILKKHQLIPDDAKVDISFKKYDWTLELKSFTDLP